jgi:hypothetical protein
MLPMRGTIAGISPSRSMTPVARLILQGVMQMEVAVRL